MKTVKTVLWIIFWLWFVSSMLLTCRATVQAEITFEPREKAILWLLSAADPESRAEMLKILPEDLKRKIKESGILFEKRKELGTIYTVPSNK